MPSEAKPEYQPCPIAIDGIELSADLGDLIEALARNVHDLWALERLSQSWTHGPERNDRLKTHPSLIDYGALAENEKAIDRKVVAGTLRAILALGFTIRPV
jgi:hypothetical protein